MSNYLFSRTIQSISFTALFFFVGVAVHAASISLRLDATTVHVGDQFELTVLAHSGDRTFNAIEGIVAFREEYAVPLEIRDGSSVINYWIEQPKRSQFGEISFSGITPGGYRGGEGKLFSVLFEAKKDTPLTAFIIKQAEMFEHSENASRIPVNGGYLEYKILPAGSGEKKIVQTVIDTDPPEIFEPLIVRDDVFGDGYVLLFATQDKGVGLDRFEVREGWWRPFTVAESPYKLKNQRLTSSITIRAIDRNGNIRVVRLAPQHKPWVHERVEQGLVAFLILIFLVVLGKYLYRRIRR